MKKLVACMEDCIVRGLTKQFSNDLSDIENIKKIAYYHKIILFTYCNYCKINDAYPCDLRTSINYMSKKGIVPKNVESYFNINYESISEFSKEFIDYYKINNKNFDVGLLYEASLSNELIIENGEVVFQNHKISRDASGSYYTPIKLAQSITRRTFDAYIESKTGIKNYSYNDHNKEEEKIVKSLIIDSKIIDPSCGVGTFIKTAVEYCEKYLGFEKKDLINNFWGFDVDFIALQITIVDLVIGVGDDYQGDLFNQFILGNPLINIESPGTFEDKIDLFALGRIYSQWMGFKIDQYFFRYNIVLGNPPWEKIRFEERKFFLKTAPDIFNIPQKAHRKKAITDLKNRNPRLFNYYECINSDYDVFRLSLKKDGCFKNSSNGELNTYSLFSELSVQLMTGDGVAGLILKGSILTSPVNSKLFAWFKSNKIINEILLFSNKQKVFDIDSRERFCVIIFQKREDTFINVILGQEVPNDFLSLKRISISYEVLERLNPDTKMLPNVSNEEELQFLIKIHERSSIFSDEFPNCHFGRLVHLTTHSRFINRECGKEDLPIYEGKMIGQYDSRFATFENVSLQDMYSNKAYAKRLSSFEEGDKKRPFFRFFINNEAWNTISKNYTKKYSLYWRSLTSSTNRRTMIATIMPHRPTCQSIQLLQTDSSEDVLLLLALFNSLPFDYFLRLKLSGLDITQKIIKQMPVPFRNKFEEMINYQGSVNSIKNHILSRTISLLKNDDELSSLLQEIEISPAFGDRDSLMKEIDELIGLAYGISDNENNRIESNFKHYRYT